MISMKTEDEDLDMISRRLSSGQDMYVYDNRSTHNRHCCAALRLTITRWPALLGRHPIAQKVIFLRFWQLLEICTMFLVHWRRHEAPILFKKRVAPKISFPKYLFLLKCHYSFNIPLTIPNFKKNLPIISFVLFFFNAYVEGVELC